MTKDMHFVIAPHGEVELVTVAEALSSAPPHSMDYTFYTTVVYLVDVEGPDVVQEQLTHLPPSAESTASLWPTYTDG